MWYATEEPDPQCSTDHMAKAILDHATTRRYFTIVEEQVAHAMSAVLTETRFPRMVLQDADTLQRLVGEGRAEQFVGM